MSLLVIHIARGLLAVWVLTFHWPQVGLAYPILGPLASIGFLAVPAFFVISGYCMDVSAQSIQLRGSSPGAFLRRRVLRIYPAYWASIIVVVAVPFAIELISALKSGVFQPPAMPWAHFSVYDWVLITSLIGVNFVDPGRSPAEILAPLNTPYWSLVIEFQFYLVITVMLLFKDRYDASILAVSTAGAICLAFFPETAGWGFFLVYWPQFMAGIALHRVLRAGLTSDVVLGSRLRALVGAFALAALFLAVAVHSTGQSYIRGHEFLAGNLFAGLFLLVIWLIAPFDRDLAVLLNATALSIFGYSARLLAVFSMFLGTISYSLYLLHGKIFGLPWMFVRQVISDSNPMSYPAILAGTLVLAWIFYTVFERPFADGSFARSRRAAA